jgi:hypothetical protein
MQHSGKRQFSVNRPRPREKEEIKEEEVPLITESNVGQISTFLLFISTLLLYDLIVAPEGTVNFQAIKTDLATSVHNQTEAVNIIAKSFDKLQEHDQNVNILNFIGSTGVGKTFIANIVKRHFYSSYELRGPLHNNDHQELISKIKDSTSKYTLIIVDDLTLRDVDNLLAFIKDIPSLEVTVLVVCIFNIQETDKFLNHEIKYDHINRIVDKFDEAGVPHETAKFHEFSKDQAKIWVVKQLVTKGVDPLQHPKIVESVLTQQNIKEHGLKGLTSKILLEL